MFLDEDTSRDGCFRTLKFTAANSSLTLGRIRAGGAASFPPSKVFGVFSWTKKHQNLTFSVAVRFSLPRILRQV